MVVSAVDIPASSEPGPPAGHALPSTVNPLIDLMRQHSHQRVESQSTSTPTDAAREAAEDDETESVRSVSH